MHDFRSYAPKPRFCKAEQAPILPQANMLETEQQIGRVVSPHAGSTFQGFEYQIWATTLENALQTVFGVHKVRENG